MTSKIPTSRREVGKAIVAAFPGGRAAAAELLGINIKKLDNQVYENTGHRPLTDEQLQQLEQITGTQYLPRYVASLYGGIFSFVPPAEALDETELYHLSLNADLKKGQLTETIHNAIADEQIDQNELQQIQRQHELHLAALNTKIQGILNLYKRFEENEHL